MKELSDFDLIRGVISNNKEAFDELFIRHQDRVFQLAFRICRNTADADDIVQETFICLFKKAHTFKFQCKFTSWLYRIASNAALMKLRSARRSPTTCIDSISEKEIEDSSVHTTESKGSDFMFIRHEVRDVIERAVASLPEKYRGLYVLREIDGIPLKQASKTLCINESVSKNRVHYARAWVKNKVQEYLEVA